MKPGNYDKISPLLFTPEELDFLQDNVWQMAESFGLDTRLANLTGKRPAEKFTSRELQKLVCGCSGVLQL